MSNTAIIKLFFATVTIITVMFLLRWQIFDASYWQKLADLKINTEIEQGTRGKILSSDGTVLAYSEVRFDIYTYLPNLRKLESVDNVFGKPPQSRELFIQKIAAVLNVLPQDLTNRFNDPNIQNVLIANDITIEQKASLENLSYMIDSKEYKFRGLDFIQKSKRIYPNGPLAAIFTGYIGKDTNGLDVPSGGIERAEDGNMKPIRGFASQALDMNGNPILTGETDAVTTKNGLNVTTTLNLGVQRILQDKISKAVDYYQAEYGTGIVMNPKTGAVLGMYQYPEFDPNEYYKVSDIKYLNNLNITDPYEPGSVAKVWTVAAGVNEGLVNADTVLVAQHNGCVVLENKERFCVAEATPRSNVTTQRLLLFSDNIAAYELSKIVGEKKMKQYLQSFGVANALNTGFFEDGNGILDLNKWQDRDFGTNAIGQSWTMTPMQLVSGFSVFGNDGIRVKPRFIESIQNEEGENIQTTTKFINQVLTADTTKSVNDMTYQNWLKTIEMAAPYNRRSELASYKIGIKTGTAEIFDPMIGKYTNAYNSTVIGYDGSENSKFVMLLKLHKPKANASGNFASFNALPVWIDIFDEIKGLLNVDKMK